MKAKLGTNNVGCDEQRRPRVTWPAFTQRPAVLFGQPALNRIAQTMHAEKMMDEIEARLRRDHPDALIER